MRRYNDTIFIRLLGRVRKISIMSAESKIEEIEKRLDELEMTRKQRGGTADREALLTFQSKLLVRLKEIRAALGNDGDFETIKRERDSALEEVASLKKELERADYRINHLVKELNKAEGA